MKERPADDKNGHSHWFGSSRLALKAALIAWLEQNGYVPKDLGANSAERCDALGFAKRLGEEFESNPPQFAVLICGSGRPWR